MTKRILVCGAGGFIGGHLVKRLRSEGYWIRGVDLKHHEFSPTRANEFVIGDLRDPAVVRSVLQEILLFLLRLHVSRLQSDGP